jgi:uncharacterized phage-associated protein
MAYDARAIANHLLNVAAANNITLSITSLLKILYFAHGWYLAARGIPLVGQKFEAWDHGPVVRVVYDAFKGESGGPITSRAKYFSALTNCYETAHAELDPDHQEFLRGILLSYARFHPYTLSEMTHDPASPWSAIWQKAKTAAVPGMTIPNEAIRRYFLSQNRVDSHKT